LVPKLELGDHLFDGNRCLFAAASESQGTARPAGFETVREAMADGGIRAWVEKPLFDEIIPAIGDRLE